MKLSTIAFGFCALLAGCASSEMQNDAREPSSAAYITHTLDCSAEGGPNITVFNDHRIKINDGVELFAGHGRGNNAQGFNYVNGQTRAFLKTNCVIRSSHSNTCAINYTNDSDDSEAGPFSCVVQDKN